MTAKRTLLKGTLILTATGVFSRLIGFFYRIFLSHTFGEEGVGLYQLIFPIYILFISFTSSGIQTAISRCVAQKYALGKKQESKQILLIGLVFSVLLSCISTCVLQTFSHPIAIQLLGDRRCEPLLIAISYTLPFASIHSCISGYYYGLKQTGIPAISQLLEQIVRVTSVLILYAIGIKKQININISIAVLGLVFGEISSALFCMKLVAGSGFLRLQMVHLWKYRKHLSSLLTLSLPLTANKVLLNILQSIEAISIPNNLLNYGYSTTNALSIYGVLMGMALPCILFPSAITSSISIMLLPTVAEIQVEKKEKELDCLIHKVIICCFSLGFISCLFFLFLGPLIGTYVFKSKIAGDFITTLAWICPFLYTNTTLISILNGMGKATVSFMISTIGLIIRIGSVLWLIPLFGIQGYLWGLLFSQIVITISGLIQVRSK
ncbi:MAG: polysaccharide biosynthesis protein [Lachnospiraceae bacterium]